MCGVKVRETLLQGVLYVFVNVAVFVHTPGTKGNSGHKVPITELDIGKGHDSGANMSVMMFIVRVMR